MLREYVINNIRLSAFIVPPIVKAKSPLQAVKKIYPTAKRTTSNDGYIVVYSGGKSFLYREEA